MATHVRTRSRSLVRSAAALFAAAACLATTVALTIEPAAAQVPAPEAARVAATTPAPLVEGLPGDLRLNQIQTIGSHNSFHLQPPQALLTTVGAVYPDIRLWQYSHSPLDQQFQSQRVRQIELDVFADSAGGRFANPSLGGRQGAEMSQPGWKVLHVNDLDFASNCTTLVRCLRTVDTWSDRNPGHIPIMILVEVHARDEVREDMPAALLRLLDPAVIERPTAAQLDTLEAEIRSVFDDDEMVTPDDVRGTAPTLRDAVTTTGWPTLAESAGDVMFALDNVGDSVQSLYENGRTSLEGRAMFTSNSASAPDAAFMKRNDVSSSISELVDQGFVVRTRAEDTTRTAPPTSSRRNDALASGAQWVSTDYFLPSQAQQQFGTDYVVQLPGNAVARCNPVSGAAMCNAAITITQDSSPDSPQDFAFTTTGVGLGGFFLEDGGRPSTRSQSFINLAPGTYTVTQASALGWSLSGLSCTTGETVDLARRRVTITLVAGEATACTFTNVGTPPDNDNLSKGAVLSGTSGTERGHNSLATRQSGEPRHAGRTGGTSVWYRWTAPRAGFVTFDTQGSGFDTLLAAYTGSTPSNLDLVESNDDDRSIAPQSQMRWFARSGTTYRIAVDGASGAQGNITLHWSYAVG